MNQSEEESTNILEEIAAFLVLIFQKYFENSDKLGAFMLLLDDADLLSNKTLSILDIRRFLVETDQSTVEKTPSTYCISYEQFYCCIRKIAIRIFSDTNMVNAFRLLIIRYFVPMAAKTERSDGVCNVNRYAHICEQSVDIACEYERFLLCWYIEMSLGGVYYI